MFAHARLPGRYGYVDEEAETMASVADLVPGDRIEIRYRMATLPADDGRLCDRWIAAEIKSIDGGAWPLARLSDGQLTEIRRYMEWRYASPYLRPPRQRQGELGSRRGPAI
jgi:hypothetical protein